MSSNDYGDSIITASQLLPEIESLIKNGPPKGISTGYNMLDQYFTVVPKTLTIVGGGASSGKALALDTKVPTPTGWTTMGELVKGDEVFSADGTICKVAHAFPVLTGEDCFEVEFSTGEKIVADAGHKWLTENRAAMRSRVRSSVRSGLAPTGRDQSHKKTYPSVVTTQEIFNTVLAGARQSPNHSVANSLSLQTPKIDLPIPPYTLGAWLGDGTSANGGITTPDEEVLANIRADGFSITKWYGDVHYGIDQLLFVLRANSLLSNKHIPAVYFRAHEDDRIELLKGLLDSDGYCSPKGVVEFCSTRKCLADGAAELVRSLGMRANVKEGVARLYGKDCGPKYRVIFTPHIPVFKLKRKLANQRLVMKRTGRHMIEKVTTVPSVPVRCISVDHPSALFLVGERMIPTHNSEFIDQLMVNLAVEQDWGFAIYSPENSPLELHTLKLMEKYMGSAIQNTSNKKIAEAVAFIDKHFFFISQGTDPTLANILDDAKVLASMGKTQMTLIDPYNELDHRRPKDLSETEYVSRMLGHLKRYARDFNQAVVLVAHPTKLPRDQNGNYPVPTAQDAAGCHSDDTEVFTRGGIWKNLANVTLEDEVACYDMDGNYLTYQHPTKIHEYDYDGVMLQIESKNFCAKVTPNHRIVFNPTFTIEDTPIRGRPNGWNIVEAKDIPDNPIFIPHVKFSAPGVVYLPEILRKIDHVRHVGYKGKVRCLTVPTSAFMTRRNGKKFISGNSVNFKNKADFFLTIHRPDLTQNTVEVHCQKCRWKYYGRVGLTKFSWDRETGRLSEFYE